MKKLNNYEEATIEHIQDTLYGVETRKDFEMAMIEIEKTVKTALSGISNKRYLKLKFIK